MLPIQEHEQEKKLPSVPDWVVSFLVRRERHASFLESSGAPLRGSEDGGGIQVEALLFGGGATVFLLEKLYTGRRIVDLGDSVWGLAHPGERGRRSGWEW